jgi:hypothetical protein
MRRLLLENIELVLSALGLVIIVVVPSLVLNSLTTNGDVTVSRWAITAMTAIGVGILHGIIFWLIRYRQRVVRRKTLCDVQMMLDDVIKNQLAIISINAQLARPEAKRLERIKTSINEITELLNNLSEEKLVYWQHHYETHLKGDTPLPTR